MRTVRAPRVFHDEIGVAVLVMGDADNGHRMAFAFPAYAVVLTDGTFGLGQQRVHWDVVETLVQPVVGQGDVYIFIIRFARVTGQGERFPSNPCVYQK